MLEPRIVHRKLGFGLGNGGDGIGIAQRVGTIERCLRVFQRDLGAVDGNALGIGIWAGNHVTSLDLVAGCDGDLDDAAGHEGKHADGADGVAGADGGQAIIDRGAGGRRSNDRGGAVLALAAIMAAAFRCFLLLRLDGRPGRHIKADFRQRISRSRHEADPKGGADHSHEQAEDQLFPNRH